LINVTGGNGTRDYRAPEVVKHNKYYHIKTDVYSFGRLINHLFFSHNYLVLEDNKDGFMKL
jgi:serine/threonine protein kinase